MEQYLDEKHFGWNRYQIAQCYMILGGIPFYLTLLNPKLSLLSNIDELFFADAHAMLRTEYNELYSTLFKRPDNYLAVIRMLTERKEGFTRKEINEKLNWVELHFLRFCLIWNSVISSFLMPVTAMPRTMQSIASRILYLILL